jgi:hypothetical protein
MLNYTKDGREGRGATEMQPLGDEKGRLTGFMSIQLDIIGRKQAEEALACKEAQLRFIFEKSSTNSAQKSATCDPMRPSCGCS